MNKEYRKLPAQPEHIAALAPIERAVPDGFPEETGNIVGDSLLLLCQTEVVAIYLRVVITFYSNLPCSKLNGLPGAPLNTGKTA